MVTPKRPLSALEPIIERHIAAVQKWARHRAIDECAYVVERYLAILPDVLRAGDGGFINVKQVRRILKNEMRELKTKA